jgi:hypothetical protein
VTEIYGSLRLEVCNAEINYAKTYQLLVLISVKTTFIVRSIPGAMEVHVINLITNITL